MPCAFNLMLNDAERKLVNQCSAEDHAALS